MKRHTLVIPTDLLILSILSNSSALQPTMSHTPSTSNNHKTMVRNAAALTRFDKASPATKPVATPNRATNP